MKRFIVALMVGGALFAVVLGAAAALNVDGGVLQAGSDEVLTCDDSVDIYYQDGWDAGAKDFTVTAVVVAGINSACDGLLIEVVLTDIAGDALAKGSLTPIVSATNATVPMSPQPLASAVYDVHVIIR